MLLLWSSKLLMQLMHFGGSSVHSINGGLSISFLNVAKPLRGIIDDYVHHVFKSALHVTFIHCTTTLQVSGGSGAWRDWGLWGDSWPSSSCLQGVFFIGLVRSMLGLGN